MTVTLNHETAEHVQNLKQNQRFTNLQGCLVQVGNGIELDTVGRQFEPYRWRPCGVTWDVVPDSRTVVVLKLLRTSAFFY